MTESEATEKVLALVVKLHRDGMQPWPPRARVSELTGVSLPMLDEVLTQLVATEQISVWTTFTKGNLRPHENGWVKKFIQPSQQVLENPAQS